MPEPPMISCLMVTQPARLTLARLAIGDFAAQTHAPRELIVVHDGDATCDAALSHLAQTSPAPVRVLRQPAGRTLGALRNAAVDAAVGDFVCQWDDDDRHHRERLTLQVQSLTAANAPFGFLCDQLHWFAASGEMFWDDWNREAYPFNVVQGTLLARRERMPRYADRVRGEDTALLLEILRRGEPIARLRDAGWCYVYVYHGRNVFAAEHHLAISRAKGLRLAALLQREGSLRRRLAEYEPGFGIVRLPHEAGCLEIDTLHG
jgi:glycosyltransferase involved in cell wall biosynthesis